MIYTVTLNPAVDRELTVPKIAFDSVLRATETRIDCGGKGFNVSRMLAELGGKSVALGFAGGRSGELLRDGLTDLGIATDFVWVNGETRTNVSVVTAVPSHYLKVNEAGPTISAAEQTALMDKINQLARPDDWWVLGGSLPPGMPKSIYGDIIERVQQAGGKAILDTSGEALRLGCKKRPFLIKPNDYEAGQLTNLPVTTPDEIATAAQALQEMGADNVVISLGKAGALLASNNAVHHGVAPKIQEMNPIGAGDALVGGLVWALANGQPLNEALRWGLATGSATAAQAGTAVGPRKLVEELVKQIKIS